MIRSTSGGGRSPRRRCWRTTATGSSEIRNCARRTSSRPSLPKIARAQRFDADFHALRHLGDALAQFPRPFAVQEILAIVKQQQARLVRMVPHPGRRVERGLQAVAGLERRAHTGLELQHRAKPERAEQCIPRGEAMIERAGRRSEPFADGRNRHLRHATLGDDRQSGAEEILLAVFGMTHISRIRILDAGVNIGMAPQ